MVYRGNDLPELTSISADSFLWHHVAIPDSYLLNQGPVRSAVISPDGRYIAVAGRRGLAHYSVNSGRWKTFDDSQAENAFSLRGGMCWYQHILIAAVEAGESYEVCDPLLSRRCAVLYDANSSAFIQESCLLTRHHSCTLRTFQRRLYSSRFPEMTRSLYILLTTLFITT